MNDTETVQSLIDNQAGSGKITIPEIGRPYQVSGVQFPFDNLSIDCQGLLQLLPGSSGPVVTIGESGVSHKGLQGNLRVQGVSDPDNSAWVDLPDVIGVLLTGGLSRCDLVLEVDGCQDNIKLHGTAGKGVANNQIFVLKSGNFKRHGVYLTADDEGGSGYCNANRILGNYLFGKCESGNPVVGTQWGIRVDYAGTNMPNTNEFEFTDLESMTNFVYCNGANNIFSLRIEAPTRGINFNSIEFGTQSFLNKMFLRSMSAVELAPLVSLGYSTDGCITGTFNTINGVIATPADFQMGKVFKVVSALGTRYIRVRDFYPGTPNAVSFLEVGMPDSPNVANPPTSFTCAGIRDAGVGNEIVYPPTNSFAFYDNWLRRGNMVLQSLDLANNAGFYPLASLRGPGRGSDQQLIRGMVQNTGGGYELGFALTHRGHLLLDSEVNTSGSCTINRPCGRVRIPNGQTSIVVTNNLVTANSMVLAEPNGILGNAVRLTRVSGTGQFTLSLDCDPGQNVDIDFWVIN